MVDIGALLAAFREALDDASSIEDLDVIQRQYLGRKSDIKAALKGLRKLDPSERRAAAQRRAGYGQLDDGSLTEGRSSRPGRPATSQYVLDVDLGNDRTLDDLYSAEASTMLNDLRHQIQIAQGREPEVAA